MKIIGWDDGSPVRFVLGLLALAGFGYYVATTDARYYLWLTALFGVLLSLWSLVLAFVPSLRAEPGTPHRAVIAVASWTIVLAVWMIAGRLALSN